ncbi:MAG: hypothetical protein JSU63_20910 [Phycisphaerales bacterium]|nr:MAG: hypothetical protein JSU63_20910 [Phycisphaerales bacterium]
MHTAKSLRISWAVAWLAPLLMTALVGASDESSQLDVGCVLTSASPMPSVATLSGQTDIRSRIAVVDLAKLNEVRDAGGGLLTLNLFDDANFRAMVERVSTHPNGYSLAGPLDGIEHGRFNLVVHDNVTVGIVRAGQDGTYNMRYLGNGTHVVRQIDPAAFPSCGVTPQSTQHLHDRISPNPGDESSRAAPGSDSDASRSADDGGVHDILVLYSSVTREAAGGTAAIRAEIQLAIDVANDAYDLSSVVSRLRLAHMEEVAYDEVTGWDGYVDHLLRLGVPDDGYFDYIHELRDRIGADFVSMIVEDTDPDVLGNGTCGMAPIMQELSPDFEVLAFSVVSRECAGDNWSLVHEVGHNQGCAHDRDNASNEGLYSYSYGYHLTGNTRGWSTIMAYDDAENNWQRFGQFSNPYWMHDGAATGVHIGSPGEAHNAATINNSRFLIAGFRTTRYWVDFDWSGTEDGLFDTPYSRLIEGIAEVPEGGMVVVKSGSTSDGLTLAKRVKINSWNGSTIIGAASP